MMMFSSTAASLWGRIREFSRIGREGVRTVWQEWRKTLARLQRFTATARGSRWHSDRAGRPFEPGARGVVDLWRHHFTHPRVVGVEPRLLRFAEQRDVDRVEVDRRQGERLELEVAAVGARDLG